MTEIHGWAAYGPKLKLETIALKEGTLGLDDVEIEVEHCGLCHSDLSIIDNTWGFSRYPVIPGHEVIGTIVAMGETVKGLHIGQRVGVGWNVKSCMYCHECMSGQQHLCASIQPTIIGRHGGFANKLRAHWAWVIPIPETLPKASAGPLLCAGITVFAPLVTFNLKPTDSIGIVGIGGLGHLGLQFAKAWGCEVTAFTSNEAKMEDAQNFGAHRVINSLDSRAINSIANSLDLLMITTNNTLDWSAFMKTLKPNGRMHVLGMVPERIPISAFELIIGQKSISGSPSGNPSQLSSMLNFAARHHIAPQVTHFPMTQVNEAIAHLASGKARFRIVLDADFV